MGNDNNTKLAKNTLYLYVRMGIGTIVSLYTSRLVLEQLGVSGYGVYAVVGSVVLSLGFLSNSLAGAVSRFFAYELGVKNMDRLLKIFNASFWIEVIIGVALFIILTTAGMWFVENELSVPDTDKFAAKIVLLTTTISFIFTIILVPYKSAVMANERFGIYAIIELGITVFKLLGVLSLKLISTDKLIIYSILMAVIISAGAIAYAVYGSIRLPECRLNLKFDFKESKPILSFASIDLFGNFCALISPQSVQWIINVFCGVLVNAAIGITNQVSGAVLSFVSGLTVAFRPQIIKEYAAQNFTRFQSLANNCSICAILMMGVFAVPLGANMNFVLQVWLKEVPPDTAIFCFISLIATIPSVLIGVANCIVHATGKVKWLSITNGSLCLLIPLLGYILLRMGLQPYLIFVVTFIIYVIQWIYALSLGARYISSFSAWQVVRRCIFPSLLLTVTFMACAAVVLFWGECWIALIASILLSVGSCGWYAWKIYRRLKAGDTA